VIRRLQTDRRSATGTVSRRRRRLRRPGGPHRTARTTDRPAI